MTDAVFPHRHVPLEYPGGPRIAGGALELAAPLALGQRGLIIAPPRCGATSVLRMLGAGVAHHVPAAEIHVVLVDRPVEERLDWREELPSATLHGTTSDSEDGAHAHAVALEPFAAAASAADNGRDVVVLIDSLASLARALVATSTDDSGRVLDGGIPQTALRELRRLFGQARARPGDEGGSLTMLATVAVETAQELDDVVLHELVGTGNVDWRLDAEAMHTGLFPPLDILASGARRTELILGEAEAERRGQMRALIDERGTVAGLGLLLDALDMIGSLDMVLQEHVDSRR